MLKSAQKVRTVKKVVKKVEHTSKLRVIIPAGMASPSPPLGSQLGQRNIDIASFVKEFNERTAVYKEGIPLPCRVKLNPDRSFNLVIHKPPATYYLKQAAGLEKAKTLKDEVAGKITFKHLYEIAVIKSEDPPLALLSLEQICGMIVGIARTCGIKIVDKLDPEEYAAFLEERNAALTKFREELQAAREAKMLRTA